jgi:hypothetical protein
VPPSTAIGAAQSADGCGLQRGRERPPERAGQVVQLAVAHGVPAPAFSSGAGVLRRLSQRAPPGQSDQAQRDYFGAHTYQRVDKEGKFHTEWIEILSKDLFLPRMGTNFHECL